LREQFDAGVASKDLRRYRRRGPTPPTRRLLDAIRAQGVRGATLLDIGGGVGAIQHELLADGAGHATAVDVSTAYLEAAGSEHARRGTSDRFERVAGDFVALCPDLAPADIVTLDRVLCCYPAMEDLVAASAARARRL
jgi:magnesium-protoporphyrin O-methyltransferase